MRDLCCELDEIRASVVMIAIATTGTGEAMPTQETISLAASGVASRLDDLIRELESGKK